MQLLARLEEAHPTPLTVDTPVSTTPIGPSSALIEMAMIHVGPLSVPVDPPVTVITPL